MRNHTDFIALDTVMIIIAEIALTAWYPGYCFRSRKKDLIEEHGPQTELRQR